MRACVESFTDLQAKQKQRGGRMRSARIIAVATAVAAGVLGLSLSAGAARSTRVLPETTPSWASSANRVGASNQAQKVGFRVYLPWRNQGAAAAYAAAASTRSSSSYGKFLTPWQFRARFAPSQKDVHAVASWLRNRGFTVGYRPSNRHYIEVRGTVAQASKAFATSFANYRYGGATLRAPEHALSVPASLPAIAGIVGLDESAALVQP